MKKVLSVFMALMLTLSVCVIGLNGTNKVYAVDYSCGDNMTWYLDTRTGELTISGTGEMTSKPWSEYSSYVKSVVVSEGVKTLVKDSFSGCSNLETVTLPKSVSLAFGNVFGNCNKLEEINFPNGFGLYYCDSTSIRTSCNYFKNQEGPVYFGSMLLGYNGDMPENYTLYIVEGTLGVVEKAFQNMENLTDIIAPDSLFAIDSYAFDGTAWYNNQPDGLIYLGKNLYQYKGTMLIEDVDVIVREGTLGIAARAFADNKLVKSIHMPDTVLYIGVSAFGIMNGKLASINLSKNVKYIGMYSYSGGTGSPTNKIDIVIPSTVEYIGKYPFSYYHGVVSFEDTISCSSLPNGLLSRSGGTRDITIPNGIKTIYARAFESIHLNSVTIPRSVTLIEDGNFLDTSYYPNRPMETVIYCYYDSAAHHYAEDKGINYVLIDTADYSKLTALETVANNLDRTLYTSSSLFILDSAIAKIDYTLGPEDQDIIDNLVAEINSAMNALEYLPADYSKVNEAVENAKNIDKSLYTYESQLALYKVLSNINYNYNITNQSVVDAYVAEINSAIATLNYVLADYSKVNEAIENANRVDKSLCSEEYLKSLNDFINSIDYSITIDRQSEVDAYVSQINSISSNVTYKPADYSTVYDALTEADDIDRAYYSNLSLAMLDNMVETVNYTLDIRYQNTVDAYAKDILNAIKTLEYKEISLKDEPTDIIVTATSLQINPRAKLTVDVIDPSEYELANYGLWGSIKNINYFDINLVLANSKIQPNGTVKVKIGLPSNMNPSKCRIYHVTDDPVDPLIRFTSTLDGNYIVFETTHFSDFALIEIDEALEGIEIAEPTKKNYNVGEKIINDNISVVANFSDGTSAPVNDFVLSFVDMTTPGDKKITVYYEFKDVIKSAEFNVTVSGNSVVIQNPNTSISIRSLSKYNGRILPYKSSITLYADVENSANKPVYWYANGNKIGEGNACTINNMTAKLYNIYCTTTDYAGNTVEAQHEKIIISANFIGKIKAFFQQLFGKLPVYDQK